MASKKPQHRDLPTNRKITSIFHGLCNVQTMGTKEKLVESLSLERLKVLGF